MKILLIQHKHFLNGSGGTEKICCFLANGFINNGYKVEIATNENCIGSSVFKLNEEVVVSNIYDDSIIQKKTKPYSNYIGYNPFLWLFYKIKKKYAKIYNKFLLKKLGGSDGIYLYNLEKRNKAWEEFILKSKSDIIITMSIESLLEITYKTDYEIPILNSTNGRPDYDYTDNLWYRSELEMNLLKKSYEKLSGIQILFDSYKEFLPNTFKNKYKVIPNPIPQFNESDIVNHHVKKEKYKIINIASLSKDCKQQHIAISVFKNIAEKYPNWDLHFYGIGRDVSFLENQIETLKIGNRVFLKGFTDNPTQKLKESNIFIFPSKYEGFPLALGEAMALGLPCIGFKNCSGVNELIIHTENGFLAENTQEMEKYLEELIVNEKMRSMLGKNAHNSVKNYNEENVINEWLTFIVELTSNN